MRAHLEGRADPLLTPGPVAGRLAGEFPGFFDVDLEAEGHRRLRRASASGRPLGAADWIKALEAASGRTLAEPRRGRPGRDPDRDTHSFSRK